VSNPFVEFLSLFGFIWESCGCTSNYEQTPIAIRNNNIKCFGMSVNRVECSLHIHKQVPGSKDINEAYLITVNLVAIF